MANSSFYQKIVSISPHVEMLARRLYYAIPDSIRRKRFQKKKNIPIHNKANFSNILNYIKSKGLKKDDILIVHSSFSELKKFNLSPSEIIDELLGLCGSKGTLAMPAMAIYPNKLPNSNITDAELINKKYTYDVDSTKIWTGILPKEMIKRDESIRSRHPLNTMVAIGPKAKEMMNDNENDPYPNGSKSSWNYCRVNSAFVIGLGTDLTHSLTMIHVAEDIKESAWYVNNWYHDRVFCIKDKEKIVDIKVKERRAKWGKLHFGERNLASDLINDNIMESLIIQDTLLESLRADKLIDYLNMRNSSGYPYFWVKRYLKK